MFKFAQHGKCGTWVSELLPHTAKIVDDIALVKTVHTDAINHDPAFTFVMTGSEMPGKPSIGSWLGYGLGSENNDLPAFVVLTPRSGRRRAAARRSSPACGAAASCRRKYSGVALRSVGDPVLYLQNPAGRRAQRPPRRCSTRWASSTSGRSSSYGDPETQTRIAQYEMAFRMQTSVPELIDLSKEPQATLDLYGPDVTKPGIVRRTAPARPPAGRARRALRADPPPRLGPARQPARATLQRSARTPTRPTAALVTDLKQRGLLDDTLVVWGGEFGRTVYCQGTLTKDELRPRPPPAQLLHVAGRRRHQGRHQSTARPTTSATTSSRTRSTSTTSTPRSCTAWASTTSGSRSSSRASTSG